MKKIVGIIAAAAILATSVFAADVSANVKLSSKLLETNDAGLTLLGTLNNAQNAPWATLFALNVSSDNAGAGMSYYPVDEGASTDLVKVQGFNVWFKPTDTIKLSFKGNDYGLFGDKYHGYYANDWVGKLAAGYGVGYAADAISFDVVLEDAAFVSKPKDADAVIGKLGAKFGYNADFGSIAAIFVAGNSFKDFVIAAGYTGSFDVVGVTLNVGATIPNGGKTTIGIDPSAGGNIDAISWAINAPVKIADDTSVGLNVKAGYAMDAATFTAYFEDSNLLAKDFAAKIGLAITGNVGMASWKVDPNYSTGTKTFAIDFETGIGF